MDAEIDDNGGAGGGDNSNHELVLNEKQLPKMNVAEMREWLKKRGLPVNGL